MGLVNLLPLPDVCNDGVNLLALRKGAEARRAFWITLAANARLAQGARPLDLPADWTQPLPDFTEHTPALTFGPVSYTHLDVYKRQSENLLRPEGTAG